MHFVHQIFDHLCQNDYLFYQNYCSLYQTMFSEDSSHHPLNAILLRFLIHQPCLWNFYIIPVYKNYNNYSPWLQTNTHYIKSSLIYKHKHIILPNVVHYQIKTLSHIRNVNIYDNFTTYPFTKSYSLCFKSVLIHIKFIQISW